MAGFIEDYINAETSKTIQLFMFTKNEYMNPKNNVEDIKTIAVVADIKLWELLIQGSRREGRLTKLQAFHDLLSRQRLTLLTSEEEWIKGSIRDFAKTWGWDRETVAKFLDNLQRLGIVTIGNQGNRKTVKVNYTTYNKKGQ